MAKKKVFKKHNFGIRSGLLVHRKMMIRNALDTMYNTDDLKQLYVAKDILYKECRKAFYENWLRL